jgi:molecular chaperone Hsp33
MQAAICLITSTLKFEGEIMLQIRGSKVLRYAFINSNNNQETRGLASIDGNIDDNCPFKDLFDSKAIMTLTVIPQQGNQYQGIIALDKDSLDECIEEYFRQSAQLDTHIQLFADPKIQKCAGLLLQIISSENKEQQKLDYEHVCVLADSLKEEEILNLYNEDVLHRLYNQESVTLYKNKPVCFKCSCSDKKYISMIRQMPKEEILDIFEKEGKIECQCNYCGKQYLFTKNDIGI